MKVAYKILIEKRDEKRVVESPRFYVKVNIRMYESGHGGRAF
jgi:hypothetical protein